LPPLVQGNVSMPVAAFPTFLGPSHSLGYVAPEAILEFSSFDGSPIRRARF
jgi:hypothetical protein